MKNIGLNKFLSNILKTLLSKVVLDKVIPSLIDKAINVEDKAELIKYIDEIEKSLAKIKNVLLNNNGELNVR